MRKLLAFASVAAVLYSCGEAGIQVNTSAEFPVEILINKTNINPDELINDDIDESLTFSLDDVDAFPNLDDLQEVEVNQLSYEITGVDGLETQISIGQILGELSVPGGSVTFIDLQNIDLDNIQKTQIPISQTELDLLVQQLTTSKEISGRVFFDVTEVPANLTDLTMEFRLYFDTTVKIQQDVD